jgi:hypothetical protein
MKFARRIPLPNMFRTRFNWFLLAALLGLSLLAGGCATDDPENASVRPWNSPQGWEGGLGGMQTQHR